MSNALRKDELCLADQMLGSAIDRARPRVRAAIHPMIERFLADQSLVFSLVDGVGSPLNIMFPDHIADTINSFQKIYDDRQLQGRIFYTSKPNKSAALKKRAALTNVGLDVSSEGELKNALASGFHPSRIEATGPKNADYLSLCLQQDVLINVDNMTEMAQIIVMQSLLPSGKKARILVRLDGFKPDRVKFTAQDSAFANNVEHAPAIINYLVAHKDVLDFHGFSFHFNAGDYIRRPPAIETILQLTFECMNRGLSPRGIDIGGGYRIRYAASQDEWNAYVEELKASVLGQRDSLTWNDSGLGFRNEGGVLKGAPNFMEHYHKDDGPQDLASVIDAPLPLFDGQSLSRILSDSLMDLYVEPGRALLDQCGITLSRVNLNKQSMMGEQLVVLDMNRTNLNATQLKLMTDPVVLYRTQNRKAADDGVMYVGNLCLTHDMIQYHKTFPDFIPETGDIVAFINTAAYQMDFAETHVLQQRIAEKIAVVETESGFRWFRDDLYNPLALKIGAY
ncbi:pyridoxal-dependent decarboxylase [Micavibrio aeruginosavorus]|uniref:pyridoxal-dependent decarboxylase n=1 Tax=Micavibrio aeruginosavorus TaxID=349221 RepID=UPI003F4AF283